MDGWEAMKRGMLMVECLMCSETKSWGGVDFEGNSTI